VHVVTAPAARSAPDRAALRAAMAQLRLAELREGVWVRPDNLTADGRPRDAAELVAAQCTAFRARLADGEDGALAATLWDLAAWRARAGALQEAMAGVAARLERGDADALAPGFVLSAAVLRHFQADPLLPVALLPEGWPGGELRAEYDRYDAAFRALWRTWLRAELRT
jgi:phenylacetic acid degradation operon negative regulatory protein